MAMKPGPPADPTALKVVKGTASREELEEELALAPPPVELVVRVKPPPGMTPQGRAVWRRLVKVMAPDTLALRYVDLFAEFCEAAARARMARADIAKRGLLVQSQHSTAANPVMVKNPANQILREAVGVMVQLGARFGLTPADARSVVDIPPGEGKPADPAPPPSAGVHRFLR
jgi:P27 family predicted phage terminase small subunit